MDSLLNPLNFFRFHQLNPVMKDKKYKLLFVSYFDNGEEFSVDFKKDYYIKNYVNDFMELSTITEKIIHQEKIPTKIQNDLFFENNINFWIRMQNERIRLSKVEFENVYLKRVKILNEEENEIFEKLYLEDEKKELEEMNKK